MKIIALADLHGRLPKFLPEHDVVCIAGDILGIVEEFEHWAGTITDKPILWIPGNHDYDLINWQSRHSHVHCLGQNTITIDNVVFGGFVWNYCVFAPIMEEIFVNCSPDSQVIAAHIAQLPACNILLSHSPPLKTLDKVYNGDHVGIPGLLDWAKYNACKYIICGHVHEQGGRINIVDGITVINAARKMMKINLLNVFV